MINYNTVEQLINVIDDDNKLKVGSHVRFPIRVIFLSNFSDFSILMSHLKVKKIDLSQNQPTDNYWYKPHEILNLISSQSESCIIYPLSEILRFLPDNELQSLLGSIFGIENTINVSQRIYIPLIGMQGKFSNQFWNNYYRQDEGAKVWSLSSSLEQKINIYQLNSDISTKLPLIENNKQWLSYWLSNRKTPLISIARSLNERWKNFLPDRCFNVNVLDNEKQLIEKIYAISISIRYHDYEREFWRNLLTSIEKFPDNEELTLETIISIELNILTLDSLIPIDLCKLLLQINNVYHRWLLKGYITSNYQSDSYLSLVLASSQTLDDIDIIKTIYFLAVQNDIINTDLIAQRKDLIENLPSATSDYINTFIKEFIDLIESHEKNNQLLYLSEHSKQERIYLCKLLIEFSKDERINKLSNFSPCLFNYLNFKSCTPYLKDEWIVEYFEEYNYSKLFHEKNERINEIMSLRNSNTKSFFDWYSAFDFLPEIKKSKIFQIDGLGLEWLSYIVFVLNKISKDYNKEIDEITIHKSYLPTITKTNKQSQADFIVQNSLDNYIHSLSAYKPYISLVEELDLLDNLIYSIIKDPSETIYITGDHGLSCQCLKHFGRVKKYDFSDSEHEGRCWHTSKTFDENNDYIYHNKYYIALNHCSLSTLPKREVHGGATPEEILIPLIKLVKIDKHVDYKIELLNDQLSYNDKKIVFSIKPKPVKMPLVNISGKNVVCVYVNDHFECCVDNLKEGKSTISITIKNSVSEHVVTKLGGIEEEDPFE